MHCRMGSTSTQKASLQAARYVAVRYPFLVHGLVQISLTLSVTLFAMSCSPLVPRCRTSLRIICEIKIISFIFCSFSSWNLKQNIVSGLTAYGLGRCLLVRSIEELLTDGGRARNVHDLMVMIAPKRFGCITALLF